MVRLTVFLSVLALVPTGCTGNVTDPGGVIDDDDDGFVEGGLQIAATDARRLTRTEYETTLRDLMGDPLVDAVLSSLSTLPPDTTDSFESMVEPTPALAHVDGYVTVADRLAEAAVADGAWLGSSASCLPTGLSDRSCVEEFLRAFSRRAFRRAPTAEEVAWLLETYDDGATITASDGLHMLILSVLNAPPFLYRLEINGEAFDEAKSTYALSAHELATRLSFFAWGRGPDDELLDAADSGALLDDVELRGQVARLLNSPQARQHVARFFAEWLHYLHLAQPAQSEEFLLGLDRVALPDELRGEMDSFVLHHVFDAASPYADLHTSRAGFPSAAMAPIYGAGVSDGTTPVMLDDGRTGILTRAALLYSSGDETSPVHRGLRVMEGMLCQVVPPPNPAAFPANAIVPPPFSADQGARERWTNQTGDEPCGTCHNRINPFGFVFESYDTLGRFRTEEPIIDPDTNMEVNRLPIDDSVELTLADGDPPGAIVGAAGLGSALSGSPAALDCFARQWLRFVEGRDDEVADSQVLDSLVTIGDEGTMLELMREIALTPQFKLRRIRR